MVVRKTGEEPAGQPDDASVMLVGVLAQLLEQQKLLGRTMDQRDAVLQQQINVLSQITGNAISGPVEAGIAMLCEQFAPLRQLVPQREQPQDKELARMVAIRTDLRRFEFSADDRQVADWGRASSYDQAGVRAS